MRLNWADFEVVCINLDAKKAGIVCGRGWVGMKKPQGQGCKRAKPGAADKQMRVKRKRLGKSPEKPKATYAKRKEGSAIAGGSDDGGASANGVSGNTARAKPGTITTARPELTKKGDHSKIPSRLLEHLNEFQRDGAALAIEAIDKHGGFLNADGTGVGKSRQILAVAANYAEKGKKVLIVTKAEVIKPNWKKGTLSGSFDSDGELMGVRPKLTKGDPIEKGGVGISTYDNLSKIKGLVDKDTIVIFDEAHAMKNWESTRSKHGSEMSSKAGGVMFATATPADKPLQLGYLQRAGVFNGNSRKTVYEWMGLVQEEKYVGGGKTIKTWEADLPMKEIQHRMSGLFDEMTERGLMVKREISLEGVPVTFREVKVSKAVKQEQANIARAVMGEKNELAAASLISRGRASDYEEAMLLATESGSNSSGLDVARALMHQRRQLEPHKVSAAVEETRDAVSRGRQVVLFASRVNESAVEVKSLDPNISSLTGAKMGRKTIAQSEGTIKLLRDELKRQGFSDDDIAEIHGGQTQTKNIKGMDAFQKGKAKVIIATVESGGTGINLDDRDGDKPRTLIMMTPPFSAVDNVQAAGRVWRTSTKSVPEIKYLTADVNVDRWNRDIIATKMASLRASIAGETGKLVGELDDIENLGPAPRPPKPPKQKPGALKGSQKQVSWATEIRSGAVEQVDQTIARLKASRPDLAEQYEKARDAAIDSLIDSSGWIDNRNKASSYFAKAMQAHMPDNKPVKFFAKQGDGELTGSPKQIDWAEKIRKEAVKGADKLLEQLKKDNPEDYAKLLPYKQQAYLNATSSSDWIDNRGFADRFLLKRMAELYKEDQDF